MAVPVITPNLADSYLFAFTELTNTTGSTFLHEDTKSGTVTDDNLPDYDITFSPDVGDRELPGLLGVFIQGVFTLPNSYAGTIDIDYSVRDRAMDFLREGQVKSEVITVTVTDLNTFESVDVLVKLQMTGKNDKPVAKLDQRTISENINQYTYKVTGNDRDPDIGDTIEVRPGVSVQSVTGNLPFLIKDFVTAQRLSFPGDASSLKDSIKATFAPAFQALNTGEKAIVTINYSIVDNFGATSASQFKITLTGSPDTQIAGTSKADILFGENDKETMFGNAGNDFITARGGGDTVWSGGGKDTLLILAKTDTGTTAATRDFFRDFVRGQDKINLKAIDSVAGGSDQAFEFIGTDAFLQNAGDNRGQLRYDRVGNNVVVQGDIGHNGTVDFSFQVNGIAAFADFFTL